MRLNRADVTAVFVGGVLGALARVALTQLFPDADASWPWAVFAINVSGAFVLGYALSHLRRAQRTSRLLQQLIGTGFCGAYTTFSTMQLEFLEMVDAHRAGLAVGYMGASVVCGYAAVQLAIRIAHAVVISPEAISEGA